MIKEINKSYPTDKCKCGNIKTKGSKRCRECLSKRRRSQLTRSEGGRKRYYRKKEEE